MQNILHSRALHYPAANAIKTCCEMVILISLYVSFLKWLRFLNEMNVVEKSWKSLNNDYFN